MGQSLNLDQLHLLHREHEATQELTLALFDRLQEEMHRPLEPPYFVYPHYWLYNDRRRRLADEWCSQLEALSGVVVYWPACPWPKASWWNDPCKPDVFEATYEPVDHPDWKPETTPALTEEEQRRPVYDQAWWQRHYGMKDAPQRD